MLPCVRPRPRRKDPCSWGGEGPQSETAFAIRRFTGGATGASTHVTMPRTDEEEWELQHQTSYVPKPAKPAIPPREGSLQHDASTPPLPLPDRSESRQLCHATLPQPEPETRAIVPQPEPEPEVPAAEQSMGGAPPPPPRLSREEETRLRLGKDVAGEPAREPDSSKPSITLGDIAEGVTPLSKWRRLCLCASPASGQSGAQLGELETQPEPELLESEPEPEPGKASTEAAVQLLHSC